MRIFLRFVKKIFEDAEVHVYKKKLYYMLTILENILQQKPKRKHCDLRNM